MCNYRLIGYQIREREKDGKIMRSLNLCMEPLSLPPGVVGRYIEVFWIPNKVVEGQLLVVNGIYDIRFNRWGKIEGLEEIETAE